MMDPDAALSFLGFVEARHEAWANRQAGLPQPWTSDPIVATRKFTNVFRVLDFGSQFVLTDLAEPGLPSADLLMRLFLYRHTGRVETWKHIQAELGGYPMLEDLDTVREILHEYKGGSRIITSGNSAVGKPSRKGKVFDRPVFTSAYLVFPQSAVPGTDKLDSIIDLTKRVFLEEQLAADFLTANSQGSRFAALRSRKGVADFMSMQILTDWGYTTEFREDDFVKAGPGAIKGATALGMLASEAIPWAVQAIRSLENPPTVNGRLPSYMDAQNCLCEFSKYVRYESKPLPSKAYAPAHPGPQSFVLPEHW